MDRRRDLFSEGGNELVIETGRTDERLVFVSSNKSGFSGSCLKEIEDNANSTVIAAKQFLVLLDKFKETVHNRAPALLGYAGFISKKDMHDKDVEKKRDKLLEGMKAYVEEEEDAI